MTTPVKRVTLSLDRSVAKDLTDISTHLGLSRSAFVNELLKETIAPFIKMIAALPPKVGKDDIRRLRGKSIDLVRERMQEYATITESISPESQTDMFIEVKQNEG